jgi:hypothetical protein
VHVEVVGETQSCKGWEGGTAAAQQARDREKDDMAWDAKLMLVRLQHRDLMEWARVLRAAAILAARSRQGRFIFYICSCHDDASRASYRFVPSVHSMPTMSNRACPAVVHGMLIRNECCILLTPRPKACGGSCWTYFLSFPRFEFFSWGSRRAGRRGCRRQPWVCLGQLLPEARSAVVRWRTPA